MCSILSALAYDTGVEHHHVRLLGYRGRTITQPFKFRCDTLRVGHVHLTASGPNVVQHERHYTGPTLSHLQSIRFGRILTAALLAIGSAGCIQRAPDPTPLVEKKRRGQWMGRTDTNKLVFFETQANVRGELVWVKVEHTGPWSLRGTLVSESEQQNLVPIPVLN